MTFHQPYRRALSVRTTINSMKVSRHPWASSIARVPDDSNHASSWPPDTTLVDRAAAACFRDRSRVLIGSSASSVRAQGHIPTRIIHDPGGSGRPGSTDGTGSAATFSFPAFLTVDEAGNVYVTDG
jgi:hypothetical protein